MAKRTDYVDTFQKVLGAVAGAAGPYAVGQEPLSPLGRRHRAPHLLQLAFPIISGGSGNAQAGHNVRGNGFKGFELTADELETVTGASGKSGHIYLRFDFKSIFVTNISSS